MRLINLLFLFILTSCSNSFLDKELMNNPKLGDYYGVKLSEIMEIKNDGNMIKSNVDHYGVYKIDTIIDNEIYFKTSISITDNAEDILNIIDLSKVEFNKEVRPVRTISSLSEMSKKGEILFVKRL